MSAGIPSVIQNELAAAVLAVNIAYNRIPPRHRPRAASLDAMKSEVDRACARGNLGEVMAIITDWRDDHLTRYSTALLNAPLEPA